jgi:hypothetical protein
MARIGGLEKCLGFWHSLFYLRSKARKKFEFNSHVNPGQREMTRLGTMKKGMCLDAISHICRAALPAIVGLVVLLASGCPGVSAPIRIQCVGDSITAGYTDNPTWRVPFEFGYRSGLYTRLTNAGIAFQFVGASPEPWNGVFGVPTNTPSPDLRTVGQDHHRGYGGWGTSDILSNIGGWLAADNPDLILLMIGINDGGSVAARNTLSNIVKTIVNTRSNAAVIVAQITPMATFSQSIVDYNTCIRNTLVPSFQARGKHVSTVNQYTNLLTNGVIDPSFFSNGINHPNAVAYDRMAQTWYDGMVTSALRKLQASLSGTNLAITWSPAFASDQLQSAPMPTGPWDNVAGSPNPSYTTNITAAQLFFRVKVK